MTALSEKSEEQRLFEHTKAKVMVLNKKPYTTIILKLGRKTMEIVHLRQNNNSNSDQSNETGR